MKQRTTLLASIFLFLGMAGISLTSQAQFFRPGPQVATFYSEIDDSEQPYGLYIPQNYDPQKQYPLVIMLHGAMSNHRMALKRVFGKSNLPGENDALASRYFPRWKEEEYIVASPWARGTMGYTGIPEEDVMAVIESCKANFNIDEERLFLTGLSMGGGGTLYIGLSRPGLFAAIAPVCPAPPEEAYALMGNALNLPVAIYQGGADPVVRPEGVRMIADDLLREGASVEYHEFPGVGHDVWVQAYGNGNIFRWFDGLKRNSFPERVKYTTRWYKYNEAYWVLLDKITPGTPATIVADREVTPEDLRSSHLFLFGTRETNQVIARMADRLPLHLKEGDTSHGLVYTYPVNGKMVVVASGIPLWKAKATPPPPPADASAARARTRISFGTGPGAKALAGRPDYLLLGENGEVISEGYFDHDWQLPADTRQKLSVVLP